MSNKIKKERRDINLQVDGLITRVYKRVKKMLWILIFDPSFVKYACIMMFLFEFFLLKLIIKKVPYTEIDYSTYMQQITQIENGELNYALIGGDTGPIVYPGGYVFIYSWMKEITKGMENLELGQEIFRMLYLVSLILTFLVYIQSSYGREKVKPYQIYLLALSKRLHSIYVLRLFNDCFATFFVLGCIFLLQISANFKSKSYFTKDKDVKSEMRLYSTLMTLLAIDCYCFGLSVKMNVLLYLPGLVIIVYFLNDENLFKTIGMILFGVFIEIGLNWQFLSNGEEIRKNFLKKSFDFNRQFMYKWSVNWKFIDEETFLNDIFHKILLILQVLVLMMFIFKKWINEKNTGKSVKKLIIDDGICKFYKNSMNHDNIILRSKENGYFIANMMMMSNLIGILFARSLHYQFLSWYFYSLPFLIGNLKSVPFIIKIVIFGIHEWCWNKYPSNGVSSICLVSILAGIVVMEYFFGMGKVEKMEKVE